MAHGNAPHRLAETIGTVCASHLVTLAYLFGSHARGKADKESDIDVAVLAEDALTKEERHRLRLRLMRDVAKELGLPVERIDMVVLQDVPVLLQYNVVRDGVPAFARDPTVRHGYEADVERRYDDESPFLEREADAAIEAILFRAA